MKPLLVVLILALASPLPARSQEAQPAAVQDQNLEQLLGQILTLYKNQLSALESMLQEECPNTLAAGSPSSAGAAKTNGRKDAGLQTSRLQGAELEAGSLPLSLPNTAPVQAPANAYFGTMYKKAIYEKALAERYRFFRGLRE